MKSGWGKPVAQVFGINDPDTHRVDYPVRSRRPAALRSLLLLVLCSVCMSPGLVQADPDYEGPLYYGLDPVLRSTDDPRLLGRDRMVLLRRMARLGVDPFKHPDRRPSLENTFRELWRVRSNVDLQRRVRLVEYNGPFNLMTVLEYPSVLVMFPAAETLPGGFQYYPPRPVDDPTVRIFIDDLEDGYRRTHAVDQVMVVSDGLDRAGSGRDISQTGGLINLTIPIKLPRTLEKIIGRGEKTKIKITGREHIAISGESSVTKPFTATERVSSQSLFPTLDMQQELQINLSGTIGEKIILEVDHNSAALGPDATKIKLMYQGLEDEVIKTIETGDVGLTLPNSQLLGYSSNKSGLFGIKVTGQVGPTDFTVVASKQKAESSAKSFNAQGGQETDFVIYSSDYINNRFFFYDLPNQEPFGRTQGQRIRRNSVKVYKMEGPGQFTAGYIENVAVYVDSLGMMAWNDTQMDFTNPAINGQRWREIVDIEFLEDTSQNIIALDLRTTFLPSDILGIVYEIEDSNGQLVQTVGDIPRTGFSPVQEIDNAEGKFYRMKLLKADNARINNHVFQYVLRNIYSLGGINIDENSFDLRIERNVTASSDTDRDENKIDYIRIFGLDQTNPQNSGGPDGIVDKENRTLFDLGRGLLKFPLDFPTPFASDSTQYISYADTSAFVFGGTFLESNQAPELYDPEIFSSEYNKYSYFKLVARHASASSSFNLGASNIQEESEVVRVDGRVLQRGVDYEIDYNFGEVRLLGEAANLSPDSKVSVDYQFSPFFGGGNSSLMGFNLGIDLGEASQLSTTWLYQSESIVGEKAKLGEEPNRTIVGNLNLNHTFKPYFLTDFTNFISRRNTERESSVQFTGEVALSLPNPNTKGEVYLEDFEGVDSSNFITLSRLGWFWASSPAQGRDANWPANNMDFRTFDPEDRVESVRWFLPQDRVLRRYLNPDLVNQERDETQPAMDMYLRADDGVWDPEDWGGIMRGISRSGLDLSKTQFIEIWINDGQPDIDERSGRLHIDFGTIDEDGFWPVIKRDGLPDSLVVGQYEQEDGITGDTPDGVWRYEEDIGLDGNEDGPQKYDAEYEINGDSPFPRINGTSRNNREDSEDLNNNTNLDRYDGYFTTVIDLKDTPALVDVVYDYDDVQELIDDKISWRKYRIPLGAVDSVSVGAKANLKAVTHARLWFEDNSTQARPAVQLQLSEFKFLGSRWEREGIRRIEGEKILGSAELLPYEDFYLGEVNNKENPDYTSPFPVNEINNIPEKEQSLVLNYELIEQGHMVRSSKVVSTRGDDYTGYQDMTWYWYNPDPATADVDMFFRVGSDSLNYYEVNTRFSDSNQKIGWKTVTVNIAELSNTKNGTVEDDGVVTAELEDARSSDVYQVRVVGRPDLRQVKRYYFGIKNDRLSTPATGYLFLNDVKLLGVKKEMGMAQRAGVRVNMADAIKVDFDWSHTDDTFHGLNSRKGSGVDQKNWNLGANFAIDDYIPLLGFRLPVNVSRSQKIDRPRYVTNSDIEILDEDTRNELSSIATQERFSTRLSHSPSKGAILRYLLDPWVFQLSGSRSESSSPTGFQKSKALQGSTNYDLRIPGRYPLGAYPLLKYIPLVRSITPVPKKIAMGANFSSQQTSATSIDNDGVATPRPTTLKRPATLTASIDYQPINVLDTSLSGTSDRDLLREREVMGINIGQENRRSYGFRMTLLTPKAQQLPTAKFFAPVRSLVKGLNQMRPSVQFTGSFVDQHDPVNLQPGDPPNTRDVSNNGTWEVRFDLPLGKGLGNLFPEKKYSQAQRDRLVQQQASLQRQQGRAGRGTSSAQPDSLGQTSPGTPGAVDQNLGLTPEEIQRRDEERLLAEAEARLEEERDRGLTGSPEQEQAQPAEGGGSKINPLFILKPVFSTLRNLTPIKFVFSDKNQSSYARLTSTSNFWYSSGLSPSLDVPDSTYRASSLGNQQNISLATTTKVTKDLSLDVKYTYGTSLRDQAGSKSRGEIKDWPDFKISLVGLERWRILGGSGKPGAENKFASSNFNISYKQSLSAQNITENNYNPNTTRTLNPRWTLNFRNGMAATLTTNISKNDAVSNGVTTRLNRFRIGLQIRHKFNAQKLLARLGLYRPGANQKISMDVDTSYEKDKTDRIRTDGSVIAPTGSSAFRLDPRFSYQITRNLSGTVRFSFGRRKDLATDQTTTTLGLGVEATFVF